MKPPLLRFTGTLATSLTQCAPRAGLRQKDSNLFYDIPQRAKS
jgi:hypothetical protein